MEVDTAITCLAATSQPSLDIIYNAIDEDYRTLLEGVLHGKSTSTYSCSLKANTDSLSVSDGLVLLNSRRIVLPLPAVKPVLRLLHASHSGVNKTITLARDLYFWLGKNNDIKQLVSMCRECLRLLQSQPSNPMTTSPPSSHLGYPMQHVGLDLFSFGGKSCVDHWSGYPLFQALRFLLADSIIKELISWFNPLGWLSSICSDGGPHFCGDFPKFCLKFYIRHELSAPYNPKSNGLAETMLRKSYNLGSDPDIMLYEWRNVPRSNGYSPGQLLFGRHQRTCLPVLPSQVRPVDFQQAAISKDSVHHRSKLEHDQSNLSLPLLPLGQSVLIQDPKTSAWDRCGVISSIWSDQLSYVVKVDKRFFIRPLSFAPTRSS